MKTVCPGRSWECWEPARRGREAAGRKAGTVGDRLGMWRKRRFQAGCAGVTRTSGRSCAQLSRAVTRTVKEGTWPQEPALGLGGLAVKENWPPGQTPNEDSHIVAVATTPLTARRRLGQRTETRFLEARLVSLVFREAWGRVWMGGVSSVPTGRSLGAPSTCLTGDTLCGRCRKPVTAFRELSRRCCPSGHCLQLYRYTCSLPWSTATTVEHGPAWLLSGPLM